MTTRLPAALAALLLLAPSPSFAGRSNEPAPAPAPVWLGEALPLPVVAKTPEELKLKAAIEKEYLHFNLLAGGKQAWEQGKWAEAADRWEALLRLPELSAEEQATVAPFALEARRRAGGQAASTIPMGPTPAPAATPEPAAKPSATPEAPKKRLFAVAGTVRGGGSLGPGGSVLWLEKVGGPTPRPKPSAPRTVVQKNKTFLPRVLAVPVGSTVDFRNDDEIFHNVFSLSRPNDFDLGLYKSGASQPKTFESPGPAQLLCNIHASMSAWVYAVPSPWFAQADGAGAFRIQGVPSGSYALHIWHEGTAKEITQPVEVKGDVGDLDLTVAGDARTTSFVPDKYGKPRQVQLGY